MTADKLTAEEARVLKRIRKHPGKAIRGKSEELAYRLRDEGFCKNLANYSMAPKLIRAGSLALAAWEEENGV